MQDNGDHVMHEMGLPEADRLMIRGKGSVWKTRKYRPTITRTANTTARPQVIAMARGPLRGT